jgi:hypothetical protein
VTSDTIIRPMLYLNVTMESEDFKTKKYNKNICKQDTQHNITGRNTTHHLEHTCVMRGIYINIPLLSPSKYNINEICIITFKGVLLHVSASGDHHQAKYNKRILTIELHVT